MSLGTRLNLELVRPRGGAITQQGSMGVFKMLPQPPETKTKLEKDLEKSLNADCRKAYAEMGLLAAGPLALDALRAKGCKR